MTGSNHRYDRIAADRLRIDESYQRDITAKKVEIIARGWNDNGVGTLYVSDRGTGLYYIIDGQHRWLACIKAKGRAHLLDCQVYSGLSYAEEAEMFTLFNILRAPVSKGNRVRAEIAAGTPEWLEIVALLGRLSIGYQWTGKITADRVLQCWGGLEVVYQRGGLPLLEETLSFALAIFDGKRQSLEAQVVKGCAAFLLRHREDKHWDASEVVERLSATGYGPIKKRQIKLRGEGHAPDVSWTIALRDAYNAKKSTRKIGQPKDASL